MRIAALCNTTRQPVATLSPEKIRDILQEHDILILLGGITPRDDTYRTRLYSITGLFDDHYIARILDYTTILVESRVQHLFHDWYIAGVGGRDPLANLQAIERELKNILQERGKNINLVIASYFCPYKLCDSSILGGRRGLRELGRLLSKYSVKVLLSCECGPGAIEINEATILCLAGGSCKGSLHINRDEGVHGKVYCGEV